MHNIFELCCDGYDQKLEFQFQKPDRARKKVYICSPFSDTDPVKQLDNMRRARLYMLYAYEHMGYLARAPHAYLPMLVCGTDLTKGMRGEITHAAKLGIPIIAFDDDLYVQTRKLVTQSGAQKQLVKLDRNHPVLGLGNSLIVPSKGGEPDA